MSSATEAKVILLAGNPVIDRGAALGAVTPGMLIEGDRDTGFQAHSTAGGNAIAQFADFADWQGDGIDTDFAAGDEIRSFIAYPGCRINALVAASATAIAAGDFLESAGDGTLRKSTPLSIVESGSATKTVYSEKVVAKALEAVDNSAGATKVRIRVVAV